MRCGIRHVAARREPPLHAPYHERPVSGPSPSHADADEVPSTCQGYMGKFRVSRDACPGVEGMFLCRPRAGLRSLLPETPGDCGLLLY